MKECTKCNVSKSLNDYGVATQNRDGRRNICRECESKKHKEINRRKREERELVKESEGEVMPFDWIWRTV